MYVKYGYLHSRDGQYSTGFDLSGTMTDDDFDALILDIETSILTPDCTLLWVTVYGYNGSVLRNFDNRNY